MNNHPTYISLTTRAGSRCAVMGLNQSHYVRKGEPRRRRARALARARIVEPGPEEGTFLGPVELDASPLLVILHYLLKNNTQFIGGNVQGKLLPHHLNVAISWGGN